MIATPDTTSDTTSGATPDTTPDTTSDTTSGAARIGIVAATETDLDVVCALEADGFAPAERWSRASWQSQLAERCFPVLLARGIGPDGSERIDGVVTVRLAGDTADLDRIVVAPRSRRQGLGARLVAAALDRAAEAGASRMLLEVDPANTAAVALYHRLGFTDLTVRSDYYGPGRHAMLMTRSIERRNR